MRLRVLVLGASGMLGHALMKVLGAEPVLHVHGTYRKAPDDDSRAIDNCDVLKEDDLARAFAHARPDVVINAIGLVKQIAAARDPLRILPVNSLLPHRLAALCLVGGARLVHISTDCVFVGDRGSYTENDAPDAVDLYGVSKRLGEIAEANHVVTLRTSIIGRERGSHNGLVEWFLSARSAVQGYRRAIFSGLPTVELAAMIRDHILPRPGLHGLYHVSAEPIDKLSLLRLVAREYLHGVDIEPSDALVIDRSLDSSRFRAATGYEPASWKTLIADMHRLQP